MPFPEDFGRYRLLSHVATGGMGKVYLAMMSGPSGFQKECIIKRLLHINDGEDTLAMFISEAKVMGLIHHQNIVQVLDFGTVNDEVYLALEYVNGPTLLALMRAARKHEFELGPVIAAAVGLRLAEALSYAHNLTGPSGEPLGIVHRDLSPGNVLFTMAGQTKLTDFGVAKVSSNPHTTEGVIKGKFAYMSPEQASAAQVDLRSDLFSLGILLYEVGVGRSLFRQPEPTAELIAVLRGQIPPPSEMVPGFPPALEAIILRLLQRDRDARYATAADVARDLSNYLRTVEPESTPESLILDAIQELTLIGADLRLPSSGLGAGGVSNPGVQTKLVDPDATDPMAMVVQSSALLTQPQGLPLPAALGVAAIVCVSAAFWLFLLLK